MHAAQPPKGNGPLQRREARLAWGLLLPTIAIVSMVVILPLLAIFWISFKPIELADLRPPTPILREALRGSDDKLRIEYRLRNSSRETEITGVTIRDVWPDGLIVRGDLPAGCSLTDGEFFCDLGVLEPGYNERFRIPVALADGVDQDAMEDLAEGSEPTVTGSAQSILTNGQFTLKNFFRAVVGQSFQNAL